MDALLVATSLFNRRCWVFCFEWEKRANLQDCHEIMFAFTDIKIFYKKEVCFTEILGMSEFTIFVFSIKFQKKTYIFNFRQKNEKW